MDKTISARADTKATFDGCQAKTGIDSFEWVNCLCDTNDVHILPIGDCYNRCYFPRDEMLNYNCIKNGPCSGLIEKCRLNHDCWNFINNDCKWRYDCFQGFEQYFDLTSCIKTNYWGKLGIEFQAQPKYDIGGNEVVNNQKASQNANDFADMNNLGRDDQGATNAKDFKFNLGDL